MSFRRLYIGKQQYIRRFNLNYPIEKAYNAPTDTNSIAQHLKKHSCPTIEFRKILTENTTILEQQNNKQNYRVSRHYILGIYNPNLIEFILKPVLMYINVFSYWRYL